MQYHTPIKRAPYYYHHDFCSQELGRKQLTDKAISDLLKLVGESRTKVVDWMKSLLGEEAGKMEEFVMMDSTHVVSKSELLTVNAKGYNPDFDFEKQIRLMYLFSAKMQGTNFKFSTLPQPVQTYIRTNIDNLQTE